MSSSESNVTGNNEAIDLAPALRKLEINEENPSEIPATSPEQARADDSTQTGVFHPADTEGRKQKDLKPGNGIYATKNVLERVAIGGLAVGERADQGGQAVVQSDRKLRSKRNIKRAGRSVASSRVSTVALKTSKLASIQLKPRIRKRQRDKGSRNLKEIITKFSKLETGDSKQRDAKALEDVKDLKDVKTTVSDSNSGGHEEVQNLFMEEMESELIFMLSTRCAVTEPPARFMPYIC